MIPDRALATRRAAALVELLEIPDSHYQLAAERYHSFGEWLHRPESTVLCFNPCVCPQGSFRYGTVNRPLLKRDEYDLDSVAELALLTKDERTQCDVKHLLGNEVKAYCAAKKFATPPEEKNRCWRLDYADAVRFHMDVLPAIPEDESFKQALARLGIDGVLAQTAIAITDKRHPKYTRIDSDWPKSNPRGIAKWFEGRMRKQAERKFRHLIERRVVASIDDVPVWEWKTPLQHSIQILKRHRDLMFRGHPELAPISMIITALATHAYEGEDDLYEALSGIVERMPKWVLASPPRIPNPVNPAEDFADRWKSDPRLEKNFWLWQSRALSDVRLLADHFDAESLRDYAMKKLGLELPEQASRGLTTSVQRASSQVTSVAAPLVIASAPRPWSR